MSGVLPLVPLGEILVKSGEQITIDPTEHYKQVTVRLWGKGVREWDVVTGAEIAATSRFVVRSGQFIASRIDARNGASDLCGYTRRSRGEHGFPCVYRRTRPARPRVS